MNESKKLDLGESVAATVHGHTIHDAAALKVANVSFSLEGTSIDHSKPASDIVLKDASFRSIIEAIFGGRAIGDGVKKFLQFQLTIGLGKLDHGSTLGFGVGYRSTVRIPVQSPTPFPFKKSTHDLGSGHVSARRRLALYNTDLGLLDYNSDLAKKDSVVFNTFVWMQIFNHVNCRRLDDGLNVFERIQHNRFFLMITIIIIAVQLLLMFFGGKAINTVDLTAAQWGCSILMGATTLPVGILLRLIPNQWVSEPFYFLFPGIRGKRKEIVVVSDYEQWDDGLLEIKSELEFIWKLKGGRLRGFNSRRWQYPREWRLGRRSRSGSRHGSEHSSRSASVEQGFRKTRSRSNSAFGSATVMAGIVAGSRHRSGSRTGSRAGSISSAISAPGVIAGGVAMGPAAQMAGIVAGSIIQWSPVDDRRSDDSLRSTRQTLIGEEGDAEPPLPS
ncbi:hypothetical protein BU23DRAFT_630669 [Bimuria novae-zelandiae CBS 107.79]|uniref:Cation-transporting P-type ATPase C-terminal domain-containing protein n=1 Tax=Bimuria novae-zelandiae CBS 107.79 TaxID=1447943 RepID=A0A6A5UIC2_9PLEO|nr:hypothetical protein BU23DRAFT_630669 [Bimuria novae-zelandiae CBS 107.79]